jgi:hypothetical protein
MTAARPSVSIPCGEGHCFGTVPCGAEGCFDADPLSIVAVLGNMILEVTAVVVFCMEKNFHGRGFRSENIIPPRAAGLARQQNANSAKLRIQKLAGRFILYDKKIQTFWTV